MKNLAKNRLTQAMCLLLPSLNHAAEFDVTVGIDDGTGTIPQTLSWSISQANTTPGSDVITLETDVTISGVMKRLIDSDVTITSQQKRRTISGNQQFRPLFIKSGNVTISNVDMISGQATGGSPGGAGMGGSIFIYDGNVNINNVTIGASRAEGTDSSPFYDTGGGGMFGDGAYFGGGGGLFASSSGSTGAYGGYGSYNVEDTSFGRGGDSGLNLRNGGFGAGGSGGGYGEVSGNGGFGGGAGSCYCDSFPGEGGFGGSGGLDYYGSLHGANGFGAALNKGAGLGGAIFVRSGSLSLSNVTLTGNTAVAVSEASGLGGAIFVMHTLENTNGNNQGMPTTLPTVTGCGVTFVNNNSSSDIGTQNDNDDIFDVGNRINLKTGLPLTSPCSDIIFLNGFE
ncbi:hypothetical protein [Marinicella sp. W31]|uniref:hypothetical protein n=1 Tax=Marinicella sp. W31 TaxID=3023713 RepID=UPI003756E7D3